jgi:hypothetical protein
MKMEAVWSFEKSVPAYNTAQCPNLETTICIHNLSRGKTRGLHRWLQGLNNYSQHHKKQRGEWNTDVRPRSCVTFHSRKVVSPKPIPPCAGQPLVSCQLLLIQSINYKPFDNSWDISKCIWYTSVLRNEVWHPSITQHWQQVGLCAMWYAYNMYRTLAIFNMYLNR